MSDKDTQEELENLYMLFHSIELHIAFICSDVFGRTNDNIVSPTRDMAIIAELGFMCKQK